MPRAKALDGYVALAVVYPEENRSCPVYWAAPGGPGTRTFFSEKFPIVPIVPNIIPILGILGRVPSEPSMLGGVPNADRNILFRAFIQCSVGARTHTIIK